MSLDHLPTEIERGVQRFAEQFHLSHDQAMIKLIEAGLSLHQQDTASSPEARVVIQALDKLQTVRSERSAELASLQTRSDTAEQLIGFLKEEPEIVENILQSVREHRILTYGS